MFCTAFDWRAALSVLPSPHSVHTLAPPGLAERRQAIPPKLLCWVDDQVAVGRLEGMSMYSSVYPDFDAAGFATSMPLHRADAWGHFAERILTAHLHWCGASVTASRSFSVGYVLSREWRTRLSTFSEGKGRD